MFFLKDLPTRHMVDRYTARFDDAQTEEVLAVLGRLREASLLIRRLDDYFADHGLSQLRFLILVVIDREPEEKSLTHGEIAARLDVSKPVLTRTLKAMTQRGDLQCEEVAADRRARRYSLTGAGRDRLESVLPGYFKILTKGEDR